MDVPVSVDVTADDESVWVERARCGDLDAFEQIMARYETQVLRFLMGAVGDVEVARELCQDTFLAAYQALPKGRGDMRLAAWLYTIALNRARSHHRRRRLRWFIPLEDWHHTSQEADVQESVAMSDTV